MFSIHKNYIDQGLGKIIMKNSLKELNEKGINYIFGVATSERSLSVMKRFKCEVLNKVVKGSFTSSLFLIQSKHYVE